MGERGGRSENSLTECLSRCFNCRQLGKWEIEPLGKRCSDGSGFVLDVYWSDWKINEIKGGLFPMWLDFGFCCFFFFKKITVPIF